MAFEIDVPAPQGPVATPGADPSRAGVQGGASGAIQLRAPQAQRPAAGMDLGLLTQFAGKLIEPIVQRQQEEAFARGLARAAAGDTAQQIAEERPEWARIFGDDAATKGARSFEQVKDSAALQTAVLTSIEEHADKSEEEFASTIQSAVNRLKTGDAARNLILQQSALAFMPDAVRMHTRARIAREQQVADRNATEALDGTFTAFETLGEAMRRSPETRDEAAIAKEGANLVAAIVPLPGTNEEQHFQRVTDVLRGQLHRGNFDSYRHLKASGALATIPAKHQDAIANSVYQAAHRFLPGKIEQYAPDSLLKLAAISSNPNLRGEALIGAFRRLNQEVKDLTGIEEASYVSDSAIENAVLRRENKIEADREREQERARNRAERRAEVAADKAARLQEAETERQAFITGYVKLAQQGDAAQQEGLVGARAKDLQSINPQAIRLSEAALDLAWANTPDPDGKAALLTQFVGMDGPIPHGIRNSLMSALSPQTLMSGGSEAAEESAAVIAGMYRRKAFNTIGRLFPQAQERVALEFARRLSLAPRDEKGRPTVTAAAVMEQTRAALLVEDAARDARGVRAAEREDVLDFFQDKDKTFGTFGKNTADVAVPFLGNILARHYDKAAHLTGKDRQEFAVGAAHAAGLRVVGGIPFIQQADQADWNAKLMGGGRWMEAEAGEAFRHTVEEMVAKKAKNGMASITAIQRLNDDGDNAVFSAFYVDKSGRDAVQLFTGNDARKRDKFTATPPTRRTGIPHPTRQSDGTP